MTNATMPTWLAGFFGEGNSVKVVDLSPTGHLGVFNGYLQRAERNDLQPTVLPRREGGTRWLYALAPDAPSLALLRDDLTAFLGATFTDLPRTHALKPDDHVDACVLQGANNHAFRVRLATPRGTDWKVLERALRRMLATWQSRAANRQTTRSPAELYARFRHALLSGNSAAAESLLASLESAGAFSHHNLLYLRVELLAGLGDDAGLLRWHRLGDVLRSETRPNAVSAAIAAAVFRLHIRPPGAPGDAASVVANARALAMPAYGSLLRHPVATSNPDAVFAFAVAAAAEGRPRTTIESLVSRLDQEGRAFVSQLPWPTLTPVTGGGDTHTPEELISGGEYATAFGALLLVPNGPRRTAQLIRCASHLGSLEAQRAALAAFEQMSAADQHSLANDPFVGSMLHSFNRGPGPTFGQATLTPERPRTSDLVADWGEWFDRLDAPEEFPQAIAVARAGVTEWSLDQLASDSAKVSRLVSRIGATRDPVRQAAVRVAAPLLTESLHRDPRAPRMAFDSLYLTLFEQLATTTEGHGEELQTLGLLFDMLLVPSTDGHAVDRYREALGCIEQVISSCASASDIEWLLELVESVAARRILDRSAVVRFLDCIAMKLHAHSRHVMQAHWDVLEHVCIDLSFVEWFNANRPPQAPDGAVPSVAAIGLRDKTVAIYTLTEQAGRRAKAVLEQKFPGVRVRCFNDLVASPRLTSAAKEADLFVMVSWSATHAATDAIKEARSKLKPLLQPTGKGTASILQSIAQFVASPS